MTSAQGNDDRTRDRESQRPARAKPWTGCRDLGSEKTKEEFTPQDIARSLSLLRHAKGWTLRQLERESAVAANTFTAYQARRRRPTLATVERLLVAMGCTWESMDLARALLREVGALNTPADRG